MKFIADLHIHSHFSIATSKNLTPECLDYWARLKGINVVGTGDCAHPGWLKELKEKLEPSDNGLFRLKDSYRLKISQVPNHPSIPGAVFFMLTGEISSIYKKDGKVRKVHNLCLFPGFEEVERFQAKLGRIGNIESDGRPILGLDSRDLLEIMLDSSSNSMLIPAHIWTPWFSALGSKSGFDNIQDCYGDLASHIFALETGLSSDPPMNWACGFLDSFSLVSNSDAHSPEKLGREANLFDTDLSYTGILNSLKGEPGLEGTIEFYCEQGKYHFDGHRKCEIRWDPLETIRHNGICPNCGKPVTKGVMYRVAELADRPDIQRAPNKKKFYSITPLPELVAEVLRRKSSSSKVVKNEYKRLLEKLGSEFHILLFAGLDEINKVGGEVLTEGIRRLRNGEIIIQEGYDGEFGRIKTFTEEDIKNFPGASLFSPGNSSEKAKRTKPSVSINFNIAAFQTAYRENQGKKEAPAPKPMAGKTKEQRSGIEHFQGPCMTLAGPGSGKTMVLTERIIYLILNKGVNPGNILALTFSNKAAEEMETRIQKKINAPEPASTFHAFGLSVLTKHCEKVRRSKPFYIVDDNEKRGIMEQIGAGKKREIKKMARAIASYKQGTGPNEEPTFSKEYEQELIKGNAFDLDDLIHLPVKIFREFPDVLKEYRLQYPWILIDEFQDINQRQYELTTLLAGPGKPNLFVIGDPDQAIYGFRGSDARFMDQLREEYPSLEMIRLEKSYRCPTPYLRIAGQVLHKKVYMEGSRESQKAHIQSCETEKSEADWIAGSIEKMMGGVRSFSMDSGISDGESVEKGTGFSDFAVLCRATALFGPIIRAFENHGIAYQVVGAEPFYQKEPFQPAISLFRKVYFNTPGLDSSSTPLADEIREKIKEGAEISHILLHLMATDGAREYDLKKMEEFSRPFGYKYEDFFMSLSIRKGADDYDYKREAVSLMTLHASKGLEFRTVFIPGCEDGIIPFQLFGKKTPDELREEERLLYVGVTRAKKYLFLSHVKNRLYNGRPLEQSKSPILKRLENDLLKQEKRASKRSGPSGPTQLTLFQE